MSSDPNHPETHTRASGRPLSVDKESLGWRFKNCSTALQVYRRRFPFTVCVSADPCPSPKLGSVAQSSASNNTGCRPPEGITICQEGTRNKEEKEQGGETYTYIKYMKIYNIYKIYNIPKNAK